MLPVFSLAANAPVGATIDASTGEIIWVTDELDGPGTFEFTVNATEGEFTDSETFMVTVNEVNQAPILAPIADQFAQVDETTTFSVAATDPDVPANDLTFAASLAGGGSLPSWLTFDSATREFTANPVEADSGAISVEVVVTDSGGLSDSQTFSVTALGNMAPTLVAPVADQQATDGNEFTLDVSSNFSDPDGDTLAFSATQTDGSALPSWLAIDSATGTFSGTPGNGDVGTVSIDVTATDPFGASADDTFSLSVADFNGFAPNMTDQVFVISATSANGTAVGTVVAEDPDPTSVVSYSITDGNAAGVFAIDAATGAITVADNTSLGGDNPHTLTVEASDGSMATTAEVLVFTTDAATEVSYTLTAESDDGTPITSVDPGQTFNLVLSVQDVLADMGVFAGVFSAYADIGYQPDLVSIGGDVVHSSTYGEATSAGTGTLGLIDEAGGIDGLSELGNAVFEVLRVPMTVSSDVVAGSRISFATNPTEDLINQPTLQFGDFAPMASELINYGTLDLTVGSELDSSFAASNEEAGSDDTDDESTSSRVRDAVFVDYADE